MTKLKKANVVGAKRKSPAKPHDKEDEVIREPDSGNGVLKKLRDDGNRTMTIPQRLFLFVVVVTLISPLHFHLDWYHQGRAPESTFSKAFCTVLDTGVLYCYALTLGFATLYKTLDHPTLQRRKEVFWLKLFCWLPLVFFIIEYVRVRFSGNRPDYVYLFIQLLTAIIAAGAAITAQLVIYLDERRLAV